MFPDLRVLYAARHGTRHLHQAINCACRQPRRTITCVQWLAGARARYVSRLLLPEAGGVQQLRPGQDVRLMSGHVAVTFSHTAGGLSQEGLEVVVTASSGGSMWRHLQLRGRDHHLQHRFGSGRQ